MAIFHGEIAKLLPQKVIAAAVAEGLPAQEVGRLLGDLVSGNTTDLTNIPGITPVIIEASVSAVKHAYLDSFHAVWYAGCAFATIGIIGKPSMHSWTSKYLNKRLIAHHQCRLSLQIQSRISITRLMPPLSLQKNFISEQAWQMDLGRYGRLPSLMVVVVTKVWSCSSHGNFSLNSSFRPFVQLLTIQILRWSRRYIHILHTCPEEPAFHQMIGEMNENPTSITTKVPIALFEETLSHCMI